ncbi:MAG: TIGR04086 family membrane protein [bacterium]|nr:TIGR04086 family membrane protein [bacterium]
MKYLKKVGISFLYFLISLLVLTLILTIFSYYNIISYKISSIIKIIIPIISFLISGFYIGTNSNSKGYLEGIKLGGIISFIMIIFNFLALNNSFKLKYLLFYLILIISSMVGSMIGVLKKKPN